MTEYDEIVRRRVHAENQHSADNSRQYRLAEKTADLGSGFVFEPISDMQITKRQEAWWPPLVLNRARDKQDNPKLSDDGYRAAVEMERAWYFVRTMLGYKTSDYEKLPGNTYRDKREYFEGERIKHREWVEVAMRDDYMNKRLKDSTKYYAAFRQMVFDYMPIKSMRRLHGAHSDTLEKIVIHGCGLYETLHFEGNRQ